MTGARTGTSDGSSAPKNRVPSLSSPQQRTSSPSLNLGSRSDRRKKTITLFPVGTFAPVARAPLQVTRSGSTSAACAADSNVS